MDVEKSSRARRAFRESCRAAIYTVLIMSSPITVPLAIFALLELDRPLGALFEVNRTTGGVVGCCLAAFAILSLVRWINRRDTPLRMKPRTPTRDATAGSN